MGASCTVTRRMFTQTRSLAMTLATFLMAPPSTWQEMRLTIRRTSSLTDMLLAQHCHAPNLSMMLATCLMEPPSTRQATRRTIRRTRNRTLIRLAQHCLHLHMLHQLAGLLMELLLTRLATPTTTPEPNANRSSFQFSQFLR